MKAKTKMAIPQNSLMSPVLFLVFNRPDTTKQVFEAIRKARPTQLFVAADGPRETRPGEAEECVEVRRIVDDGIDWDCKVHRLYRDKNLGCKIACSSAVNWFFEHVNEGIILEDDCLPHPTFFQFCEELLKRYRDDNRIMQITGTSLHPKKKGNYCSYYFSNFGTVWGWATWKRAWKYYDVDIKLWPEIKKAGYHFDIFDYRQQALQKQRLWDKAYNNEVDTWDYQWVFAKLINNGLNIVPNVNLISNIGFNELGTHTKRKNKLLSDLPINSISFPLHHPDFVFRDKKMDKNFYRNFVNINPIKKIVRRIRNWKI